MLFKCVVAGVGREGDGAGAVPDSPKFYEAKQSVETQRRSSPGLRRHAYTQRPCPPLVSPKLIALPRGREHRTVSSAAAKHPPSPSMAPRAARRGGRRQEIWKTYLEKMAGAAPGTHPQSESLWALAPAAPHPRVTRPCHIRQPKCSQWQRTIAHGLRARSKGPLTKPPDVRAKQRAPGHTRPSQWRPSSLAAVALARVAVRRRRETRPPLDGQAWLANILQGAACSVQRAACGGQRWDRTLRLDGAQGNTLADIPSLGSLTAMRGTVHFLRCLRAHNRRVHSVAPPLRYPSITSLASLQSPTAARASCAPCAAEHATRTKLDDPARTSCAYAAQPKPTQTSLCATTSELKRSASVAQHRTRVRTWQDYCGCALCPILPLSSTRTQPRSPHTTRRLPFPSAVRAC